MKNLQHYQILAGAFRYPNEDTEEQLIEFTALVCKDLPDEAEKATRILDRFNNMTLLQQQEYYMKTFDVQAVCYLDLGYVMFGEDYKRAQLLVNLQNEHVKAGVNCGTELADHLPNVLVLLARSEDPEFAEELGFVIISQAIRFMLTKFKKSDNLYKGFLELLLVFLQHDFKGNGLNEYVVPEHVFQGNYDFLMPSPSRDICKTVCNKRNTYRK